MSANKKHKGNKKFSAKMNCNACCFSANNNSNKSKKLKDNAKNKNAKLLPPLPLLLSKRNNKSKPKKIVPLIWQPSPPKKLCKRLLCLNNSAVKNNKLLSAKVRTI